MSPSLESLLKVSNARAESICAMRPAPAVSIVIPTLNAATFLPGQLEVLSRQTLKPVEIVVIDSSSSDHTIKIAVENGCRVEVIDRSTFDHGGTRNIAANLTTGEFIVFMTQDALPIDECFLANLVAPIHSGTAAASYARQLAYDHAFPPEKLARAHNYPAVSHILSVKDIEVRGLKAFFFSNVASAVRRSEFEAVGGFPARTIMNEDMLLCGKLLRSGRQVAYCADSVVYHSHNYPLSQQFKRNFDIGVFVSQHGAQLGDVRSGKSGLHFAVDQIRTLSQTGHLRWIPRTIADLITRFVAFRLGRKERILPTKLKRRLSMHSFYW
jgi:rhamnosyltransferase